jgi:hypothetical protein
MITISQAIAEIIRQTPFLEVGIANGVINLSALARELRPRIEKRLYKSTTIPALVMALKRIQPKIDRKNAVYEELQKLKNLTVRSGLIEYAFRNSVELIPIYKTLMDALNDERELFVNLSQGVSETTIIASQALQKKIEQLIPKSLFIGKILNLAAITLRLREEHIYVPGIHYALSKALAWENINIIETISSYSEVTFVVEKKDLERAFACIRTVTG